MCPEARTGELGMFSWKREGSDETLEFLPVPKGVPGVFKRDLAQEHGVMRQRRVALR